MKKKTVQILACISCALLGTSQPTIVASESTPLASVAHRFSFDAEWLRRISIPEIRRELTNDLYAIEHSAPSDILALQHTFLDHLVTNGAPRPAQDTGWVIPPSAFPAIGILTNLNAIVGDGAAPTFAVAWLWSVPAFGGIRQSVDRAAVRALVQMRGDSLPALYRVLSADPDRDADGWRRHRFRTVCWTISAIADTNALPVLLAHIRTRQPPYSDDDVSIWLKNFGYGGLPQIIANLDAEQPTLHNACWATVTAMTGQAPTRRRVHADDNPPIPEHSSSLVDAWWGRNKHLPFFQETLHNIVGTPTDGVAIYVPSAECAVNGKWGIHFGLALVDGRERADLVLASHHVEVVRPDGSSARLIPSDPKISCEVFAYRPPLAATDAYYSHTVYPWSKWYHTEAGQESPEWLSSNGVYKVRLCGQIAEKGRDDGPRDLVSPWVSVRIADSLEWTNAP